MARYKTKVIRFDDCVSITVPNEDLDEFEWMVNSAVPVDYVSELREKFKLPIIPREITLIHKPGLRLVIRLILSKLLSK